MRHVTAVWARVLKTAKASPHALALGGIDLVSLTSL